MQLPHHSPFSRCLRGRLGAARRRAQLCQLSLQCCQLRLGCLVVRAELACLLLLGLEGLREDLRA
eukprot:297127-Chlamydomonas_euryale.AAC.1